MLSSIYTKAYFISKYNLNSILIRNPCFYNKMTYHFYKGIVKARSKERYLWQQADQPANDL